jgi:hypothetical protein
MLLPFPWPAVVAREWKGMAPSSSLLGLFMVFFLRCDCRSVKLCLAGHGGEGRMRLDVTSVVGSYCSGILDWRYYSVFPISYLPDVLEKDLSSHPSGWALLRRSNFKAYCGDSGGSDSMVCEDVLILGRVPILGW